MKQTALLLIVISGIILSSCVTSKPYTQEMKDNLKAMYKEDQDSQNYDEKRFNDKKYIDSMNTNQDRIMKENSLVVKEYFKSFGFPGVKQNDEKTTIYFWTIVQHSDHDVTFQEKVLKALKREVEKGNAPKRKYAYLYDRVCKNKGKKQLFGTQVEWSTGKPQALPLQYPDKVNEYRKQYELETLEEYYKSFFQ